MSPVRGLCAAGEVLQRGVLLGCRRQKRSRPPPSTPAPLVAPPHRAVECASSCSSCASSCTRSSSSTRSGCTPGGCGCARGGRAEAEDARPATVGIRTKLAGSSTPKLSRASVGWWRSTAAPRGGRRTCPRGGSGAARRSAGRRREDAHGAQDGLERGRRCRPTAAASSGSRHEPVPITTVMECIGRPQAISAAVVSLRARRGAPPPPAAPRATTARAPAGPRASAGAPPP